VLKNDETMEPTKPVSGLGKRVLSALLLAPLAIAVIGYGRVPFILLMIAAFVLAMKEWHGMCHPAPHSWMKLLLGAIYLGGCILSFSLLRLEFHGGGWLALGLMVGIWSSDSGAYMTGKMIGGPRLAPKISPKKTWAGFGGSMLFCGLGLMLVILISPFSLWMHGMNLPWSRHRLPVIPLDQAFLAGLVLGCVGQAGDLLESHFKRCAGLKDSGRLIPGHGGLLDRIDALLLAAPVFLAFAWFWLK
jgi:phosphatidate cytidylyltransferase